MKKKNAFRILLAAITFIAIFFAFPQNQYLIKGIRYYTPNIDDHLIFETRTLAAADRSIAWDESSSYNTHSLSAAELAIHEQYQSVSMLVVHDSAIVFEQYWDGYSRDRVANIFSASKSVISLLVGCAISDGYITTVNDKVSDYLPEYKTGKRAELTIKNLLTMSSGLNWDESYSNPFSVTAKAYYGTNLWSLVENLEMTEEQGKEFKYLSGNTQLIAFVLAKATGKTISHYAQEKLWQPLGTESDALWYLDKKEGFEKSYCCLSSTARDLAKIGQMVLQNGKWNGKQLVPEAYIKEMLQPASQLTDSDGEPLAFYGYQWWVSDYKGHRISYARGIFGQYIIIIHDKNTVIVRQGHKREKNKINHHPADFYKYIDMVIPMIE